MRPSDLYIDMFINKITGGSLIKRGQISSLGIKTAYGRFLTKKYETKVWCIFGVDVHYQNNLTQGIRQRMFREFPKIRTVVHLYNQPANIAVNGAAFERKLNRISKDYEAYQEILSDMSPVEKVVGKVIRIPNTGKKLYLKESRLNDMKDKYDSFAYVHRKTNTGAGFTSSYFFVQASAKTYKELVQYSKRLEALCKQDKVFLVELTDDMNHYLSEYCPWTLKETETRHIQPVLFSDENLSYQLPYKTSGLVGGDGILFGIDWKNKLPFLLNLHASSAAEVFLVLGQTGCGKTITCFELSEQLVGRNCHTSVIDFKGNEWVRMSPFIDQKIISMDDKNPKFVNTLRLDDLRCNEDNCVDMYNNAKKGTITLLALMVNLTPDEGNESDLEMILEQAVSKVFSSHDIVPENPKTFSRTKGLTYQDVINIIPELESTKSYTEQQKVLCKLIRTRCAPFFSIGGRYSEAFKNEITVGEILDSPQIVYSFNKNTDATLDLLDTIRVYMVMFLDGKKQAIRKELGLQTAVFYEELQRCQRMDKLVEYISGVVTGSRSSNVSVFLLLNAISTFDNSALGAIKSNITSTVVGKVTSDDIRVLVDQFDCASIENDMRKISEDETETYRNCFAIKFDTGVSKGNTIFKTILPKETLKILNTRDHE